MNSWKTFVVVGVVLAGLGVLAVLARRPVEILREPTPSPSPSRSAAPSVGWVLVKDNQGLFSVEVPVWPEVSTNTGSILIECETLTDGEFKVVIGHPGAKPRGRTDSDALLGVEKGAMERWSPSPSLVVSHQLPSGALVGREATFPANSGGQGSARFLLTPEGYIVMLRYVASPSERAQTIARRFFESFEWRPTPKPTTDDQVIRRYDLPAFESDPPSRPAPG